MQFDVFGQKSCKRTLLSHEEYTRFIQGGLRPKATRSIGLICGSFLGILYGVSMKSTFELGEDNCGAVLC